MTPARTASLAVVGCFALLAAAGIAAQESVERPAGWAGVMVLEDRKAGSPDEPAVSGVLVGGVIEGGPAAQAGIRARDRILTVDGEPVSSMRDLVARIGSLEPDRWVTLTWERDGESLQKMLRLATRPARTDGLEVRKGWVGLQAIDLPPTLREHFGAPEDAGVMISAVEPSSPAEDAGFRVGDVVYEVEGDPTRSRSELKWQVAQGGVGNLLEFTVVRDGAEMHIESLVDEVPD